MKECVVENAYERVGPISMGTVRGRWCKTHNKWEYEWPETVTYTWPDGTTTTKSVHQQK